MNRGGTEHSLSRGGAMNPPKKNAHGGIVPWLALKYAEVHTHLALREGGHRLRIRPWRIKYSPLRILAHIGYFSFLYLLENFLNVFFKLGFQVCSSENQKNSGLVSCTFNYRCLGYSYY